MSSPSVDVTLAPLSNQADARPVQNWDLLYGFCGNWSVRLDMAGDATIPDGPVVLTVGLSLLRGFVTRAGDDRGQYVGIIVGGRAQTQQQGLDKPVTGQHYYQTPARTIIADTLSQVGEVLAPDSQGLDQLLEPGYARRAIRCSDVLDEVCDLLGLYWRVRLDGSVYFARAPELTWPASPAQFTYETKEPDLASPLIMPLPNQLLIEPGQTVTLDKSASAAPADKQPQRVVCVHSSGNPTSQQTRLWFQDPNADLVTDDKLAPDSVHAGMAALARQAVRGVDWYRTFQGTVVTQRADGTLDVNLDRIRGRTEMPPIRGAAVSVPVGGSALTVRAGDRVSVYYEGGDPRRARCGLYETGSGSLAVARQTDTVDCSVAMATWMSQVATAINAIAPGSVAPPAVKTIGAISSGSPDLKLRK